MADFRGNIRKNVLILVAIILTYNVCGVACAALASLQNVCWTQTNKQHALDGVSSFSSAIVECNKVYRYWWFVATAQQMTLTGLIIDVALSGLKNTKASWVGMFSIMTLLFISMTEAFLTAESTATFTDRHDVAYHKGRTMSAGCIMTCIMDIVIIFLLGTQKAEEPAAEVQAKVTI